MYKSRVASLPSLCPPELGWLRTLVIWSTSFSAGNRSRWTDRGTLSRVTWFLAPVNGYRPINYLLPIILDVYLDTYKYHRRLTMINILIIRSLVANSTSSGMRESPGRKHIYYRRDCIRISTQHAPDPLDNFSLNPTIYG